MASTAVRGKKRSILVALIALFTIAGLGTALAYWTSTGTGTGEATTGESVAFTITSDPAVGTISPGNAGQTVDFTVTNPGDGSQLLADVAVTLAEANGVAWVPPAGCDIDDYNVAVTTAPAYGEIAAGGSLDGTATVTLTNTAVNQDACQGADVPLYFVAS